MAIRDLRAHFKRDLSKATSKFNKYATSLGSNTLVEFSLNYGSMVAGAMKGTNLVIAQIKGTNTQKTFKTFNTRQVWGKIITKKFKDIKTSKNFSGNSLNTYRASRAPLPGKGMYFGQVIGSIKKGFPIIVWDKNAKNADKIIEAAVKQLVDELWEDFNDHIFKKGYQRTLFNEERQSGGSASAYRTGAPAKTINNFRKGLKKEHGVDSSKAKFALETEQMFRGSELGWNSGVPTKGVQIQNYIMHNLQVDWNQVKLKKKYANYNVKNVLKLRLGRNKAIRTDVTPIMKLVTPYIQSEVLNSGLLGAAAKASKPIKTQIKDDVVNDTVKQIIKMYQTGRITKAGNLDMRFKRNKTAISNFNKERSGNLMSPSSGAAGVVASVVSVKKQKSLGKRPRPQKEKRKDTQNLFSIQTMINKKLPAEVRRNMGRPALRNQTGRFSNSVKMQNIRETKAGITADYTYMLSPYETFENTGRRTWPNGYNPKPLIAKSIRNLAMGLTEQKFTQLRRK